MVDDELWHVRMSPDEVKQLTLEQLDDLFRLEVIEADTLLWQPGMTEWLPLSVVAGLEDEDPNPVSIPVSLPPPRPVPRSATMAQTQTAWPPKLPPPSNPPPPRGVRTPPPPSARSVSPASAGPSRLPPLSNPPPPPGVRSAPPPSVRAEVAAASSWPPPAAWSNPPGAAPVSAFAMTEPLRSAPAASVAPVALSEPFVPSAFATIPSIRSRRSSGGGAWMVVLAVAAGAAVTLYRNDIVHAAALSMGQEGTYLKLETALGGPSFGTPRAVQQMAAAAAAVSGTVTGSTLDAPARETTSAPVATVAATSTPTPEPAATQAPSNEGSTTTASATSDKKEDKATLEPAKASSSPKASAPVTRAVSHAAPTRATPAAAGGADPFTAPKKAKKGKGNEYDPLNGSL